MDSVEEVPEHHGVFVMLEAIHVAGAKSSSYRIKKQLVAVDHVSKIDPRVQHHCDAVSVVSSLKTTEVLPEEVEISSD